MSYRENLAVSQDGTLRLRYHCRNSRCTAKLHPAVANPRDAFCCRGCFETYYRHRCLACERPIPRTTERQVLCGRVKCAISSATGSVWEVPAKSPVKTRGKSGRGFAQIADPKLSSTSLELAA